MTNLALMLGVIMLNTREVESTHGKDPTRSYPTLKWSFAAQGEINSSPALSADESTIYFGSTDKNVYALDATTGAKKWSFPTGDNTPYSSPAISPDGATIYIGVCMPYL